MWSFFESFWRELVSLSLEMSPYLLLGFLFAGILHGWFPSDKMSKYLGKNNSASALNAALLGIPLPLCSCGVIPTGVSFYKNGASRGSAVSFLISTPQTGVDSVMVTWSLLGFPMAVIRPIIALFTGIFGGILTNKLEKNNPHQEAPQQPIVNSKQKTAFKDIFRYAFGEFMQDIVKWLIIGLLVAAFIAVAIPENFFLKYLSNDYLSMLVILLISIPMYVCATGSVPIAAVLMMKGLSPGAAIVFLMAGPATNAATISVIGNSMGRKVLYRYLFSIVSGAFLFGILVNEFLPDQWFILPGNLHSPLHSHEILPQWIQISSAIILIMTSLNALIKKYLKPVSVRKTNPTETSSAMRTTINVSGMNCHHCKTNVENGILRVKGITAVDANIVNGKVTLEGENVDLSQVKKTINKLGYKFLD